jgi:hypothetical protein
MAMPLTTAEITGFNSGRMIRKEMVR